MNGEVHQTGRYLGDRAIYTCGGGWEIVGPEERVCQADGLWSNNEPYCKKRGELKSDIIPRLVSALRRTKNGHHHGHCPVGEGDNDERAVYPFGHVAFRP